MVGTGQLHVVERLSARQFDLAGVKKYIDRDLGHLPADIRKKLVYTNVKNLYDIDIPHPVQ